MATAMDVLLKLSGLPIARTPEQRIPKQNLYPVRGGTHIEDRRAALFGLMFTGIPSVNSMEPIYKILELLEFF